MRALETRLKAIVGHAPAVICLKDRDGTFVFANELFAEHFGFTVEEIAGKTSHDLFPEARANSMVAQDRAVLDSIAVVEQEQLVLTVDGPRMFVDIKFPILDQSGQAVAVGLSGTDVTTRKQAEEALRESEARFKAVVENSPNRIYLKDLDGRYMLVNKIYGETMGMSAEEAIGKTASDWAGERWAKTYAAHDREVIEGGEAVTREMDVPMADGSVQTHIATKFPVFGADGRVAAVGGIGVDITERKRAEEEARERETLLTHAAEIAGLGHWVWDEIEDRCVSCSAQLARIFGFASPEAYVAASQSYEASCTQIHPDDWERYDAHVRATYRDRSPFEIEYRIVRLDGEVRHVRELSEPILDESGRLVRSIGTDQDITESKRAAAALRESEELFRGAFEDTGVGIVMLELDGRFRRVNRAFVDMLGYDAPESVDWTFADITYPDDLEIGHDAIRQMVAGETDAVNVEKRYLHKRGHSVWVSISANLLRDPEGRPLCALAHLQDISERKRAEEALHENEARLRQAQENARIGNFLWDAVADRPIHRSTVIDDIYGLAPGQSPRNSDGLVTIAHPEDHGLLRKAIATALAGEPFDIEFRIERPDGEVRHVHALSAPEFDQAGAHTRSVGTIQDVTERKQAEEQLRQAQKMEAVGQLTGGIAHDFNNLLAVILGNVELASEKTEDGGALSGYLDAATQAALRGAELTGRLLVFSREQPLRPQAFDLNAVIGGMTELLHRSLGEAVRIETTFDDALWPVHADPGQLENALLNLAINARDAMPEGGTLRIETANVAPGRRQDIGPDAFVMLAIGDTGTGIAPEIADRVFEPFFTTKEAGKGSGLGLSMAYGFVKQSGGHMEIESEPGQGATLRLYLPRRRDDPDDELIHLATESKPDGRGRTVLVVEDEDAVRELAVNILESLGYETIEAPGGESGLAILDSTPDVSLLFSDVVLPGGMNGLELAQEARRRPRLKVLFTSGYTDFAGIDTDQLTAEGDFISKPFRKKELAERLRVVLGE